MCQPLGDETPAGVHGWERQTYEDEVMFWLKTTPWGYRGPYVSQYPLVSGFFVTDCPDGYEDTTHILAGPFPTLETAIASIALTS